MRHLLADWKKWTAGERITAVSLLLGALVIPAALAAAV